MKEYVCGGRGGRGEGDGGGGRERKEEGGREWEDDW